jgi:hypothetical protein
MFASFNLGVYLIIYNSAQFNLFLWKTQFMHFIPYFLSPHSIICCLKINKDMIYIYVLFPIYFQCFLVVKI